MKVKMQTITDWILKIFLILLFTSLAHADEEVDMYLKLINPSPNAIIETIYIEEHNIYILKVVDGNVTYIKNLKAKPSYAVRSSGTVYSDENPYVEPIKEEPNVIAQEGMTQVNDWKVDPKKLRIIKRWKIRKD